MKQLKKEIVSTTQSN